jgi:predicted small lipoprotein YifL
VIGRAAALALAAALAGCGVKGPPRPPERPAPATPVRQAPPSAGAPGSAPDGAGRAGAEAPEGDSCDDGCGQARPAAGGAEAR